MPVNYPEGMISNIQQYLLNPFGLGKQEESRQHTETQTEPEDPLEYEETNTQQHEDKNTIPIYAGGVYNPKDNTVTWINPLTGEIISKSPLPNIPDNPNIHPIDFGKQREYLMSIINKTRPVIYVNRQQYYDYLRKIPKHYPKDIQLHLTQHGAFVNQEDYKDYLNYLQSIYSTSQGVIFPWLNFHSTGFPHSLTF